MKSIYLHEIEYGKLYLTDGQQTVKVEDNWRQQKRNFLKDATAWNDNILEKLGEPIAVFRNNEIKILGPLGSESTSYINILVAEYSAPHTLVIPAFEVSSENVNVDKKISRMKLFLEQISEDLVVTEQTDRNGKLQIIRALLDNV